MTPTPQHIIELAREVEAYIYGKDTSTFVDIQLVQLERFAELLLERYGQPEAVAQEPAAYECPKGCGCWWRNNHNGTMSLFDGNQKSCSFCENLPLKKLWPVSLKSNLYIDQDHTGNFVVIIGGNHKDRRHAQKVLGDWKSWEDCLYTTPQPASVREALNYDEFMSLVDSDGICIDPELAWLMKELVEKAHGIGSKA